MVTVHYSPTFCSILQKIKDSIEKERIKKQIRKIIDKPDIGKPMRYSRKGTREVYLGSFRLSYGFIKEENTLIFLDLYHKDEQ